MSNLMPHRIEEGMLAVFHREHLLQFWSQSDDFEASAIVLSSQFIQEMHIDLKQAIPVFIIRIRITSFRGKSLRMSL